ncbi:MAG: helix-turn-helix domain-containing protein [Deltaproteobacteria bacterium]|nr:helix-turn-helix domain-containing protein [Deltaproteobacteria bacterium]
MSKIELSPRAKAVYEWIRESCHTGLDPVSSTGSRLGGRDDSVTLSIRQQTLADLLGCSRRSIYRALKQLKEQGCLVETGKRENRCKVYAVRCHPALDAGSSKIDWIPAQGRDDSVGGRDDDVPPVELCPQAKFHLDNCRNIFRYNFPEDFDWEKHFPEATHKIRHVDHQTKFWRLMFDNLYLIQERETGKPHSARVDNPDSTLFGISYPKTPPPSQIDYILRTRPAYRPYRSANLS